MEIEYTRHFEDMMKERAIRQDWIDKCLKSSEKIEDHKDGTRHFLIRIEEHGNRWLRVVIDVTVEPNKAITSFFDRRMKRKP